MARHADLEDSAVFRVVVEGGHWSRVKGPYRTIGAAKGRATRERDYYPSAKITIQKAETEWKDAD